MIDVNVGAALWLTQAVVPYLRDCGPGSIVYVASRPVPDVTFETKHTLNVGGERVNLAWHGTNHTPDKRYIHFPGHHTLMLVDIFLPRWVPFDSFNLNEDVPGSIAAPDTAMAYPPVGRPCHPVHPRRATLGTVRAPRNGDFAAQ
jgi:hypothetical protein